MRHKKLIALITTTLLSASLSAQTIYLKPHFGAKIGMNTAFTRLSPNYTYILRNQTHFNFGAFYRIRKDRFIIQPELEYTVKGGTFKGGGVGGEDPIIKNNFNYFVVSPTIGYILTEGLTLEGGPQFGFRVNTVNAPYKANETSLSIGLRYDVLDALEDLSFSLRYNYGLTNISPVASQTMTNRTVQLSVIYNWYKKK